ncbi:hypothetical protein [Streptomyces sp. SID3343]|uniref:hypothetical protein n=1 Tax=Streptomyces sp. SID3343 TaxID=2690260 RepID=UPI00136F9C33|nr:hypothetical protein [Streptomyces sp. SID3343]MYW04346.1 hypothetical protein [Streptomyces sp. SID3343]
MTEYPDAARAHDHAAAIRVAHARRLDHVPKDLAALVRHGPVDPNLPFPAFVPEPARGRTAVLTLLTALTARELDLLLFVEIGTEHLSGQWVTLDDRGFVYAPSANWSRQSWSATVPWLPADDATRDLTLAGGVGTRPSLGSATEPAPLRTTARRLLRDYAAMVLDELGAQAGARARQARALVLVERRPDWAWCALAARELTELVPPVAILRGGELYDESVRLPTLIERMALDVPVRHAVHLVGLDLTPGASTRERYDVLLRRGAIPGSDALPLAEVTLGLHGAPRDGHELRVVGPDPRAPAQWREADRTRLTASPGEATVAATMTAPGRVEFTWIRGAARRTDDPPPVFERVEPLDRATTSTPVPRPWWPRTAVECDVLCAVELGGRPAETGARLDFVRALLAAMGDGSTGFGWGRACVLGYQDHPLGDPQPWEGVPDPVRRVDFTTPNAAHAAIGDWTRTPVVDRFAAPLERVCAVLAGTELDWSPHVPTLVVTVGRRRPHPYVGNLDPARAYTDNRWDEDLARSRAAHRTHHLLVTEDPAYPTTLDDLSARRTEQAWRLFGADGCFTLGHTTPANVLRFGNATATAVTGPPLLLDVIPRAGRGPGERG